MSNYKVKVFKLRQTGYGFDFAQVLPEVFETLAQAEARVSKLRKAGQSAIVITSK